MWDRAPERANWAERNVNVQEDIFTWAQSRAAWYTQVLAILVSGNEVSDAVVGAVADHLASGQDLAPLEAEAVDQPSSGSRGAVCLRSITDVAGVSALAARQTLSFGSTGITVVFGENGSGKSSYARLVKSAVRSRHRHDEILPNIFLDERVPQKASVDYTVDGEQSTYAWPTSPPVELKRVAFYDEACRQRYVTAELELAYRPEALLLLDGLVDASDRVRMLLDAELSRNRGKVRALPRLPEGTEAARLLESLSAAQTTAALSTLEEGLRRAVDLPEGLEGQLERRRAEVAEKRRADPTREKKRRLDRAQRLAVISKTLRALDDVLGRVTSDELIGLASAARQLRGAAEIASRTSFGEEPVAGVGDASWRALWEAARRFSTESAYRGDTYPVVTDGAACVLCHQELDDGASARLRRFEDFVRDDTSSRAEASERALASRIGACLTSAVRSGDVQAALALLRDDDDAEMPAVDEALSVFDRRRLELEAWDRETRLPWDEGAAKEVAEHLEQVSENERNVGMSLDAASFEVAVAEEERIIVELEAQKLLAANWEDVHAEVQRRSERLRLEAARSAADTRGITRKSSELSNLLITEVVIDRFTRELDRLRLEHVTLRDGGGRKGQLLQKPGFLGAAREVPLPNVLSEGEQTVLALAGFLTEAHFDETRSALVFDDPVSSLDHGRRGEVAKRLVEFAKDRQVIVFTHDHTFAAALRKASDESGVSFTPRSIERSGGDTPGLCRDRHPWDLKDVTERITWLEQDLGRIRRDCDGWDRDQYNASVGAWAGSLSMTWERLVSVELAGRVFEPATLQVKPTMLKVFAGLTAEDDSEFQRRYGKTSEWARRHDKALELNYTAPRVQELDDELQALKVWRARIKKYAN